MTLQLLHSEFPYIGGKFDFLFYQCSTRSGDVEHAPHKFQIVGAAEGLHRISSESLVPQRGTS
jgi:hypothetical protein